jgi:hypothetical protein
MADSRDERKEIEILEELPTKKPYEAPELVVHGTVQRITEGSKPGHQQDGLQQNRSA